MSRKPRNGKATFTRLVNAFIVNFFKIIFGK